MSHSSEALNLFQQFSLEIVVADGADGGRLRHIVGSAEAQGSKRDLGAARGKGRGHDDADTGIGAQKLGQSGQTVHDRHFDIQHDHIHVGGSHLLESKLAILHFRHHGDSGIGLKNAGKSPANDRGVVADHYSRRFRVP